MEIKLSHKGNILFGFNSNSIFIHLKVVRDIGEKSRTVIFSEETKSFPTRPLAADFQNYCGWYRERNVPEKKMASRKMGQ